MKLALLLCDAGCVILYVEKVLSTIFFIIFLSFVLFPDTAKVPASTTAASAIQTPAMRLFFMIYVLLFVTAATFCKRYPD